MLSEVNGLSSDQEELRMSLKSFFLQLLTLKKRTMTITRVSNTPITGTIIVHPCVYSRQLEAADDITVRGQEFIITLGEIEKIPGLNTIKKGDKLTDPDLGIMTIKNPKPMFDLGGGIIAYRCETS